MHITLTKARRRVAYALLGLLLLFVLFLLLDFWRPLPMTSFQQRHFAQVVVDKDGLPLRAFADEAGVWRYPVTVDEVSPLYIEALINYEDQYFYQHFGVNPLAIVRAIGQRIKHGRYISGASTLTMQVARIMQKHDKTFTGKVGQMFRALQLEWHYSKTEILNLYINYAPFGGPLEGVQAAAFAYLGKSAQELTPAEAALLAVLPQAPSYYRPDRYPQRAREARDKVLNRLHENQVWSATQVAEAQQEPVFAQYHTQPMIAPLLARRLSRDYADQSLIISTIERDLQQALEALVKDYANNRDEQLSVAVMVVENSTMATRAYIGSADFFSDSRDGQVDMIQAIRSPGSTLKPFIYGLALDQGLIHSQSLLLDVPQSFDGYRPHNFSDYFSGPVSVSQSLIRSLNMPAVQLLDALNPEHFYVQMHNAGLPIQIPGKAKPNLSLALGGGGVTMEQLVGVFSALGQAGEAGKVRYTEQQPVQKRPLLSPGAAWITQHILAQGNLNNKLYSKHLQQRTRIAFKTGTSYGSRDAWAIAANQAYTIAVWVGRPDGAYLTANTGRLAAVPLLQQIVSIIGIKDQMPPQPATVSMAMTCWPLGTAAELQSKTDCHRKKQAYVLNNTIPPTLRGQLNKPFTGGRLSVLIDKNSGQRVSPHCASGTIEKQHVTVWPLVLEPWLPRHYHRADLLPEYSPECRLLYSDNRLQIDGIHDRATLYPEAGSGRLPAVELTITGSKGMNYWFINGQLISQYSPVITLADLVPGSYHLQVIDTAANRAEINFTVAL